MHDLRLEEEILDDLQDAFDKRLKELLDNEFNPMNADNIREALGNLSDEQAYQLSQSFEFQRSNLACLLNKWINDYWMKEAEEYLMRHFNN